MKLSNSTWQKFRHESADGRRETVLFLVIGKRVFARICGVKGNKSRLFVWQVHIEPWLEKEGSVAHPTFTSSASARTYVDTYLRKFPAPEGCDV